MKVICVGGLDFTGVCRMTGKLSEFPMGAHENFKYHYARVSEQYGFSCEAGDINHCYDFLELMRCFNAISDWIMEIPNE